MIHVAEVQHVARDWRCGRGVGRSVTGVDHADDSRRGCGAVGDRDLGDCPSLAEFQTGRRAERQRVIRIGLEVGQGPHQHLPGGCIADNRTTDDACSGSQRVERRRRRPCWGRREVAEAGRQRDRGGGGEGSRATAGARDRDLQVPIERGAGAGEVLEPGGREVDVFPREVGLIQRADDHIVHVERGRQRCRDLCQRDRRVTNNRVISEGPPDVLQARQGTQRTGGTRLPQRRARRQAVEADSAVDHQVTPPVRTVIRIGVVDRDVGDTNRADSRKRVDRRRDRDLADVGREQVELVQAGVEHGCSGEGGDVGGEGYAPKVRMRGQDLRRVHVDVDLHHRRDRTDTQQCTCGGARCVGCQPFTPRFDSEPQALHWRCPEHERCRTCVGEGCAVEEGDVIDRQVTQRLSGWPRRLVEREELPESDALRRLPREWRPGQKGWPTTRKLDRDLRERCIGRQWRALDEGRELGERRPLDER